MPRSKILLALCLLFICARSMAQETYIIEGDTLQLRREVKGPLSLFYTGEELEFRYFVQKGSRMLELEEERLEGIPKYKLQLQELTSDAEVSVGDVKFALYSLKYFVNLYNAKVQEDYTYNASTENIKKRVGLFTGISNNIYTENPENVLSPIVGLELEFYDPNLAPRHSAFLHLRQSFKRESFRYTSTQLSLNYRFKALRLRKMDLHLDVELVNLMYSNNETEVLNETGTVTHMEEDKGFSFTTPLSLGVGTDIKITDRSYLTLGYNDIISLVLDGNGSFPVDFSLGYKYDL